MGAISFLQGDQIDLKDVNRYIQTNTDLIVAAAAHGDADAQQIVTAINLVIDSPIEEHHRILVDPVKRFARGYEWVRTCPYHPDKPDSEGYNQGMHHCPFCGLMVLGRIPHIPPDEHELQWPDVAEHWERKPRPELVHKP